MNLPTLPQGNFEILVVNDTPASVRMPGLDGFEACRRIKAGEAIELENGTLGKITITTRKPNDQEIQIISRDNGKGIAPENLKHVFEPFFTTKPAGPGRCLHHHAAGRSGRDQ